MPLILKEEENPYDFIPAGDVMPVAGELIPEEARLGTAAVAPKKRTALTVGRLTLKPGAEKKLTNRIILKKPEEKKPPAWMQLAGKAVAPFVGAYGALRSGMVSKTLSGAAEAIPAVTERKSLGPAKGPQGIEVPEQLRAQTTTMPGSSIMEQPRTEAPPIVVENVLRGLVRTPLYITAWKTDLIARPVVAVKDMAAFIKEGIHTWQDVWKIIEGDEEAKAKFKEQLETYPVETAFAMFGPIAALLGIRRGGKALSRKIERGGKAPAGEVVPDIAKLPEDVKITKEQRVLDISREEVLGAKEIPVHKEKLPEKPSERIGERGEEARGEDLQRKPEGKGEAGKPTLALKEKGKPTKAKTPEEVAAELDITYNGIQEGAGDIKPAYVFTDKKTGTTLLVRDLNKTGEKLTEMRKPFEEAEAKKPTEKVAKTLVEKEALREDIARREADIKFVQKKQVSLFDVIEKNTAEVEANLPTELGMGFDPLRIFHRKKPPMKSRFKKPPEKTHALDEYVRSNEYKRHVNAWTKFKGGFHKRFTLFWQLRKDRAGKTKYADAREMLRQGMGIPRQAHTMGGEALTGVIGDLTKKQADLHRRLVLAEDLAEALRRGEPIPEILTAQDVQMRLPELRKLAEADPAVKASYARHRLLMKAVRDELVRRGRMDPRDAREFYYPHEMPEYMDKYIPSGFGKLKRPFRTYTLKRKGSLLDINTDYLDVMYRHMTRVLRDNMMDDMLTNVADRFGVKVKKSTEKPPADMPDAVQWQAQPGRVFFESKTITDQRVLDVLNTALIALEESVGKRKAKRKAVISQLTESHLQVGGLRETYWLPKDLAATLDGFKTEVLFEVTPSMKGLGYVKWWLLQKQPARYFRRNLIGDFERAVAAVPQLLGPRSWGILWKKTIPDLFDWQKSGKMSPDLKKAYLADVISGGEVVHEIGAVTNLNKFEHLAKQRSVPQKVWKGTIGGLSDLLRGANVTRENLMRLHTFYYNLERQKAGLPMREGISDIKGLTDPVDMAAKIARETLGDYGAFTKFENVALRHKWAPFYSWLRINTTFWPQLFDKQGFRKATVGRAATAPIMAGRMVGRVAKLTARVGVIYAAIDTWNNTIMKEHEDNLPSNIKSRFHLILGKDYVYTDPTAIADFMETIGLEGIGSDVAAVLRGRLNLADFLEKRAIELIKSPFQKGANIVNPLIKAPVEAATRYTLFPDMFNPRKMQGNLAQRFVAGAGFREFTSIEQVWKEIQRYYLKPYRALTGAQKYEVDFGFLWDSYTMVDEFLGKKGIEGSSGIGTHTEDNRKLFNALLSDDIKAAEKVFPKIKAKSFKSYLQARTPFRQVDRKYQQEFIRGLKKLDLELLIKSQGAIERIKHNLGKLTDTDHDVEKALKSFRDMIDDVLKGEEED